MENQMDTIINQLSHIEGTAVRIMESADHRKKELSLEMEERTRNYDASLKEEMDQRLEEIRRELQEKQEAELARLEAETARELQELKDSYQKHHSAWAQEILHSIIGA